MRSLVAAGAHVVDLPGAPDAIDFDDIAYSPQLARLIVPARRSGLYLIDPRTGTPERVGHLFRADSADERGGIVFVADRERHMLIAEDPRSGRTTFSVRTQALIDYVRYVASTRKLCVTEPAASPSGIEVFALASDPHRDVPGFIPVPGGPRHSRSRPRGVRPTRMREVIWW